MGTPFKMKGSPMARNYGIGSPLKQGNDKMSGNELVAIRTDLKEKRKKLNDGKPKLLGNLRRKKNLKKLKVNQDLINKNPDALKWKNDAKKTDAMKDKLESKPKKKQDGPGLLERFTDTFTPKGKKQQKIEEGK